MYIFGFHKVLICSDIKFIANISHANIPTIAFTLNNCFKKQITFLLKVEKILLLRNGVNKRKSFNLDLSRICGITGIMPHFSYFLKLIYLISI